MCTGRAGIKAARNTKYNKELKMKAESGHCSRETTPDTCGITSASCDNLFLLSAVLLPVKVHSKNPSYSVTVAERQQLISL